MNPTTVAVVGDHQNSLALAETTAPRGPASQPTNSDLIAEPPQRSDQVAHSRDYFPQPRRTTVTRPGPHAPTAVELVAAVALGRAS